MTLDRLINEAISRKNRPIDKATITDDIFLIIENDADLMSEYNQLVTAYSKDGKNGKQIVNRRIGRTVKLHYNLTNDVREKQPKSKLIKSHMRFK